VGVLSDTVSHPTVSVLSGSGDTNIQPNNVESNLIYSHRTPAGQNRQFFPGRTHRDMGDMSDRGLKPEEEGDRRPTLYLILDPDQDPSCSSEAIMLVGTKEELRSKTGGDDVLGKGV